MSEYLPEFIMLEHSQRVHWAEVHAWKLEHVPRRSWRIAVAAALRVLAALIAPQAKESATEVGIAPS